MFVLSMLIAFVIVREGDSVPQRTGGFEAVEMDVMLEVCVFNLGQIFLTCLLLGYLASWPFPSCRGACINLVLMRPSWQKVVYVIEVGVLKFGSVCVRVLGQKFVVIVFFCSGIFNFK